MRLCYCRFSGQLHRAARGNRRGHELSLGGVTISDDIALSRVGGERVPYGVGLGEEKKAYCRKPDAAVAR